MTRKEAIEVIKRNCRLDIDLRKDCELFIPELTETKDERIRKWLIEMVEEIRKANPNNAEHNGNCSEAIAYLEKLGEQKYLYYDQGFIEGMRQSKLIANSEIIVNPPKIANKVSVSEELYEHIRETCARIDDAMSSKTLVDMTEYLEMADKSAQAAFDMLEKQKEQSTDEEMLRTLRTEYENEKGVADTIAKYEQEEQKPTSFYEPYNPDDYEVVMEGNSTGLKRKDQNPVEKEITLTNFEEILNTFLFNFANSPLEDCNPKEYIKKHSAEILNEAYKELKSQLQQDFFEAQQEGRREGYEAAMAEAGRESVQKEHKPSTPKYRVGDVMRTKQEAVEGITDGLPVIVSVDEDYYYCTNEKIPISEQEEYEFPPMNMRQKPIEWSEDIIRKAVKEVGLTQHQIDWFKTNVFPPKQEWSEEDKKMLLSIINAFRNGTVSTIGQEQWLKSLPERFIFQPKQEWSEEDKKKISELKTFIALCKGFNKANRQKAFNMIDALRPPQYCENCKLKRSVENWKPSEEQMGALNYAYCELFKRGDVEHNILGPLQKLIDQLREQM